MLDILQYLPAKRKATPSGWLSFDAPCCQHNGNSPDQRQRGGLKTNESGWSYHCFNCGYTTSFILGRIVSYKARGLLRWLGVSERDIDLANLESLRHRSIYGIVEDRQRVANILQGIDFEERDLPPASELITPEHPLYWNYIRDRRVPEDFPMMTPIRTDGVHWTRPCVVVPFTYNNKIVGYTARFLDGKRPKFISEQQPGYVFGTDLQDPTWQHVLVMEGIFDALCIGGVAVLHNDISDAQARLIRSLGREITVIPDQDSAGIELIDRAMELGWAVSIPHWEDCKDVNDAVKKYGRLGTLLTIMQARETSRIKIELRKKALVKRLRN
jgi:hypothetical protein